MIQLLYNAIDVANYLIKKSIDEGKYISNIKLQKLLYYLQARFLVEKGQPLFNNTIEKWYYGPVVPDVYHEYKSYGSGVIKDISKRMVLDKDENGKVNKISVVQYDDSSINDEDKQTIDETFESLSQFGAFQLVDLTHNQPLWYNHRNNIVHRNYVAPYDNDEILNYFSRNEEEQIWRK